MSADACRGCCIQASHMNISLGEPSGTGTRASHGIRPVALLRGVCFSLGPSVTRSLPCTVFAPRQAGRLLLELVMDRRTDRFVSTEERPESPAKNKPRSKEAECGYPDPHER